MTRDRLIRWGFANVSPMCVLYSQEDECLEHFLSVSIHVVCGIRFRGFACFSGVLCLGDRKCSGGG